MKISELEQDLRLLADKKNELDDLDYSSDQYDSIEHELHELEDGFQEKYGEYLEEALSQIHDEFCPDNDVLLPIAYLAKKYTKEGAQYDVHSSEGVLVDADDFPSKNTRLVLVPGPTRILLIVDNNNRQVVWTPEID